MNVRVFFVALLLVGCGNGGPGRVGSIGNDCYPNDTCDDGLSCVASSCVDMHADAGPGVHCTAGAAGCIPAPPAAATSSASDATDVTFALRDVLLTQTNASLPVSAQPWRSNGSNLDGIATVAPGDTNGCAVGTNPDGGVADTFPVDGLAGIDNQFGAQLAGTLFPLVVPRLQSVLCCQQSAGRGTLLVRVRGWNGMPDDAHVTVSLTSAFDGTSSEPSLLSFDAASDRAGQVISASGAARTPAAPPSWVPDTDTWYTNSADLASSDLDMPRHVDVDGFVTSGYFVMHIDPTRALPFFLGAEASLSLPLRGATMVMHVSSNGHLIDEGWVGGRLGADAILDIARRVQAAELSTSADNGDNSNACTGVSSIIAPLVDAFGDVLANGTNDPSVRCDALSAGVSFHGVRARGVQVAPASLAYASPDCDGQTAVLGTVVPENATCGSARGAQAPEPLCAIRAWSVGD